MHDSALPPPQLILQGLAQSLPENPHDAMILSVPLVAPSYQSWQVLAPGCATGGKNFV